MYKTLASITRLLGARMQWFLLWLLNSKFGVGVSAVVFNSRDEILLLRHRFRKNDHLWSLPSGWLKKGETLEQAICREVLEETGLRTQVTGLLSLHSGYRLRVEACFSGILLDGGVQKLDAFEILDAGFFSTDRLPEELFVQHKEWIDQAVRNH